MLFEHLAVGMRGVLNAAIGVMNQTGGRLSFQQGHAQRCNRQFGFQRASFEAQLAIARRLGCAVVIHSRAAFGECVQMIDASEQIYLLEKDKLRSFQKSRESMMPTYTRELLSDQDLDDIVAYLISLGAK